MPESRRTLGSKLELAPGKYRLMVSAGRDPVSGKRRRLSKVFYGSERDAERELSRLILKTGRTVSTSALTVWDFIETMYLPAIEPPELRRRTVDEYRAKLERYVKPTIGSVRLDQLDAYACVSWWRGVQEMATHKQTQLHVYRALSAVLGRAVKWGIIHENVLTRAVTAPVPDHYSPTVLTEDQANDYLDAFAGHLLEPLVVIMIAAGTRPSEAYALTWADVDFEDGSVRIDKGKHERKGDVWLEEAKSRASNRTIALPEWAVESLRRHRGLGSITVDLKPTQIAYRYRQHVKATGLPYCPIENLRHTSLTIASERGVGWSELQDRAGHVDEKMLRDKYIQRRALRDRRAATAMQEFRRPGKQREAK